MDADDFESELKFATSMQNGAHDALYWSGYRRGLLRARLGSRFSSNSNHFAWRDFKGDDDPIVAELGRGYVDGINTVVNGKPAGPRPLESQASRLAEGLRRSATTGRDQLGRAVRSDDGRIEEDQSNKRAHSFDIKRTSKTRD